MNSNLNLKFKKLISAVVLFCFAALCFSSCKTKTVNHGVYEKIYEKYSNLKAFEAKAEISIKSNLTENVYTVKQYYLSPNNFKTQVLSPENLKGIGYTISGEKVNLTSNNSGEFYLEGYVPEDKSCVFINDFFEGYFKSQSAFAETVSSVKGSGCTLLRCNLSEENPKHHSQCLWINNKSLLPEKLITYDIDGEETITVTYKSFSTDEDLIKKFFN